MDELYIKTEVLNQNIVHEYCKDKDLITIDNLLGILDDIYYDLNYLKDELEEYKRDVEENYKFVGQAEQIGYDERTW